MVRKATLPSAAVRPERSTGPFTATLTSPMPLPLLSVTVTESAEDELLVVERLAGRAGVEGAGVEGAGAEGTGAGGAGACACADGTFPSPRAIALVIRSRFIPRM